MLCGGLRYRSLNMYYLQIRVLNQDRILVYRYQPCLTSAEVALCICFYVSSIFDSQRSAMTAVPEPT